MSYPNTAGARSPHAANRLHRTRSAFVEVRGVAAADCRSAEIEALPAVEWKGRPLRTIRCHGTTGKGPHNVNAPESLLWSLIDVRRFFCPFHPPELQAPTEDRNG